MFGENSRQEGVSGYYRIYNEEEFLSASVESHLPFFDELVLVNDSSVSDRSPQIAKGLEAKYPDKIKYILYEPCVAKLYTREHKILPIDHPRSFINYYNFTLSQTTRRIVVKVDAGHIAIQSVFTEMMKNVRNPAFMKNGFYTFGGLNLFWNNNEIYVDPNIAGIYDHGFCEMRKENDYYVKSVGCEKVGCEKNKSKSSLQMKVAGIAYFHLKYRHKRRLGNISKRWLSWEDFVKQHRDRLLHQTTTDIAELPNPNEYLKEFLPDIFAQHKE